MSIGDANEPRSSGRLVAVLAGLLLLFCFRVLAQLLQAWRPVPFLPPFDAWASGAVPYRLLVVAQVVIIGACVRVIVRLFKGVVRPSANTGRLLLVLGGLYFGAMCGRLVIGLTVAPDHVWFGATLPTLFHLVLASFLLVYGQYHRTGAFMGAALCGGGGV